MQWPPPPRWIPENVRRQSWSTIYLLVRMWFATDQRGNVSETSNFAGLSSHFLVPPSESLLSTLSLLSLMSAPPRQHNEQQQTFLRQANILRKNLNAWDGMLHSARGEDWPSMLGRLNAAFVSSTQTSLYSQLSICCFI